MKNFIRKWLGITEAKAKPFVIRVDHPDSLEDSFNSEMQKAYAHFFKQSAPGRVLIANLYQDVDELMQQASSTENADLRDYLICKAGGKRELLATILKLCIVNEEVIPKHDQPMVNDEVTAALGHEYEIGDER